MRPRLEDALAIVTRHFDEDQLAPETRPALEELSGAPDAGDAAACYHCGEPFGT